MDNDCAATRKLLRRYLQGHLFKYQQIRISRHLSSCPLCRSEYQALEMIADTRQLLNNVTVSEGLGHRLQAGTALLARLKVLLYRPLWLLAIVGVCTLVYVNLIAPRRRDIEIENIEKHLPPPAAVVVSAPAHSTGPAAAPVPPLASVPTPQLAASAAGKQAAPEQIDVVITPANDHEMRQVNEVLLGQSQFKKKKFSQSVHEISGVLAPGEFAEFIDSIGQAARVSYNRKKALSYPASQPISFVMKMKSVPKPAPRKPSTAPADTGEEKQTSSQPASAPLPTGQ